MQSCSRNRTRIPPYSLREQNAVAIGVVMRQLAPPEAERAPMSTAFQPQLAQQGIHVTQLRVRLGLDDEPVAGHAHWAETEDDQRLWLADFVVRSGAGLHVRPSFLFSSRVVRTGRKKPEFVDFADMDGFCVSPNATLSRRS